MIEEGVSKVKSMTGKEMTSQIAESLAQQAHLGLEAQSLESSAGDDPDAWGRAADAYDCVDSAYTRKKATECRQHATYCVGVAKMQEGSWSEPWSGLRA